MNKKIALFTNTLTGGGMERAMINIANQLSDHGYQVDLLLASGKGSLFNEVSDSVNIICLNKVKKLKRVKQPVDFKFNFWAILITIINLIKISPKALRRISQLRNYVFESSPDAILSTPMTANLTVILACENLHKSPKLFLREASTLSEEKKNHKSNVFRSLVGLVSKYYAKADKIICVSDGVKMDLVKNFEIPDDRCVVLRNPIDKKAILDKAEQFIQNNNSYNLSQPFILGMGRLEAQKDFSTLIHAFKKVSQQTSMNLLILGEGSERLKLESLISKLNLSRRVFLPGFVGNPYPYLKCCEVFVLSSRWEGLANVLREAMVFNKKIVATDCPSGTEEILKDYPAGVLVKIDNANAMSDAILNMHDLSYSVIKNEDNLDRSDDYLKFISAAV